MRIIGYIDTNHFKTTVFKNNAKFIIKFEDSFYEQTFKFNESDYLKDLNDIKKLIDLQFLNTVEDRFKSMHSSQDELMRRFIDFEQHNWIEII